MSNGADEQKPLIWLPDLLELTAFGGDWKAYDEAVYAIFKTDFLDSEPTYPGRKWAVKRYPEALGRPATFWHVTSDGPDESKRVPDLRRCERIAWPRPLIDACHAGEVMWWEQTRRNKSGGQETRVALSVPDFSYITILADRKTTILLWTTFYVEYNHQRRKYGKEHAAYWAARSRAGKG